MNINRFFLEIWIGLANVKDKNKEVLKGANEGFVNVLAMAENKTEFRKGVKDSLEDMGLELLRLEDAEPLNIRLSKYRVDSEIIALAKEIMQNSRTIRFSTFHVYTE